MAAPRWLDDDEDRAWRGWLAMSLMLRAQIARDLQTDSDLSDSEFSVLVHLSAAPDGRMRMTALADALDWSKSRVSHQCSRMQVRGLVAREGCPDDARSSYAVLTACGRTAIERAAPGHVESVRRHLIDLLDAGQLRQLTAISEHVIAHLQELGRVCAPETSLDSSLAALPSLPATATLPICPTQARPAGATPAG